MPLATVPVPLLQQGAHFRQQWRRRDHPDDGNLANGVGYDDNVMPLVNVQPIQTFQLWRVCCL